jgi:hypothetical protein
MQRQLARTGTQPWAAYVRLWGTIVLAFWLAPVAAGALPGLELRAASARLTMLLAQAGVHVHVVDRANVDATGNFGTLAPDGGLLLLSRDRVYRAAPPLPIPRAGGELLLFLDRTTTFGQLRQVLTRIPATQPIALAFLAATQRRESSVPAVIPMRAWAIPVLRPKDTPPARVLRPGQREPDLARVLTLDDDARLLASVPLDTDSLRIDSLPSSLDKQASVSAAQSTSAWSTAPLPKLAESWPMRLSPSRWLLVLLLACLHQLDVGAVVRSRR